MMVLRSDPRCSDKVIHGMVAFVSTLGFEMLTGSIASEFGKVSLSNNTFKFDDEISSTQHRAPNFQLFTAFFKRPAPKTGGSSCKPLSLLRREVDERLVEVLRARSIDWNCSLCSEDLAGIKELRLVGFSPLIELSIPSDWPLTSREARLNHRLYSQPLLGFGHRPMGQHARAVRYELTVVGVNQAGFFTFVHSMLLISGFRVVSAEIETVRGSYATNRYLIETYSVGGERLLRANFQCVVPIRSFVGDVVHSPLFQTPVPTYPSACGVWFADGNSAYHGCWSAAGQRDGFGRFWTSRDKLSLTSYTFEGDWEQGEQTGFGFQLTDDGKCIAYNFGKFENSLLVDGCVVCPFEPPAKSVRVDPNSQPVQCMYRTLIQRAEHWRRQLPKGERPVAYLPASKLKHASHLRMAWTLFAESPVPATASMNACQVAALLETCGLGRAAKSAFANRIDGELLEAMTCAHLIDILHLTESQANMFAHFASVISKAHNIDRHMRQPASVLDALSNPSISGRFFPLDRMRVVDSLGEGAFGKVVYAEYNQGGEDLENVCGGGISKSQSLASLGRVTSTNSLGGGRQYANSAASRRSSIGGPRNMYVALKEQVGSGALLENSCELVREWATLNAIPHENIVKLEGICADTNAPMFNKRFLATALIEASLPSLIYARDSFGPAPPLTPLLTIQLAGDIASGLAHMHSLHLLHGDIKSPNILVDIRTRDRAVARICDFGHAAIRVGPRPQRRMCTFGWAAPESLRDAETDVSADVWSWAVVVWEMYVREIPWRNCSHPQMLAAVGFCGLSPSGFQGQRIPERVTVERKISKFANLCWNTDPAKRPTMNRVLHVVDKLGRFTNSQAAVDIQALLQ